MFIAALLTIAEMWKKQKCPSMDEWISKMCYTHTIEYFFDSKNIVLFIEVIKGIYHTSILHTKHLRHKDMEVNF